MLQSFYLSLGVIVFFIMFTISLHLIQFIIDINSSSQRMKKAMHDEHITKGAIRNYKRVSAVSCTFITGFVMSQSICALDEGYEIKCVVHFLARRRTP